MRRSFGPVSGLVLSSSAILLVLVLVLAAPGAARAVSTEIGLSFTGRTAPPFGFPPDTMGAVGEEHIVELVNTGYAVYSKSDGSLLQDLGGGGLDGMDAFWIAAGVTPERSAFDPRVLYDSGTQRWFAVAVDGGVDMIPPAPIQSNRYLVAVSNGPDPTQGWTGFAIDADPTDANWADFPTLGLDADGVYVGARMFGAGGGVDAGNSLLAIPKSDLVAPTPTVANATLWPNLPLDALGFNPQPAVNLDGGGTPAAVLSGDFSILGALSSTRVEGPIDSPTLAAPQLILVPQTDQGVPYRAAQPGSKLDLDAGNARFSGNVVQVDGSLWAVQSTRVDGRVAIRWYEIDADTNILLQAGELSDPTLDLFYPSVAVNEFDQVVMGMSGSSETDFVGAYAVVGETLDGVTSFGELLLLQAGLADYELTSRMQPDRNRWGDYSATVVDPTDPLRFWTFQEYVHASDQWGVRITELILIPEPTTALLLACGLVVLGVRRRLR